MTDDLPFDPPEPSAKDEVLTADEMLRYELGLNDEPEDDEELGGES